MLIARCPECGSEDLRLWSRVDIVTKVSGVFPSGNIETEGDAEINWETEEQMNVECNTCGHGDSPHFFVTKED
jgi:DNA-directed RNA polymerase subunit RPC12/RpoP